MGWFDGLLDNVGLDDVLRGVGSIWGAYNATDYNNSMLDAARAQEEQMRRNHEGNAAAYADWAAKYEAANAANAASAGAASRAAAAQRAAYLNAMTKAKLKEEKNKQAAAKKGLETLDSYLTQASGLMQPWYDAGMQVLPQKTQAFSQGLGNLGLAQDWLKKNSSRMASAMLPSELPINKRFNVSVGR